MKYTETRKFDIFSWVPNEKINKKRCQAISKIPELKKEKEKNNLNTMLGLTVLHQEKILTKDLTESAVWTLSTIEQQLLLFFPMVKYNSSIFLGNHVGKVFTNFSSPTVVLAKKKQKRHPCCHDLSNFENGVVGTIVWQTISKTRLEWRTFSSFFIL